MERFNLEQELKRCLSEAAEACIGASERTIYEEPLVGIAAADDPMFLRLKEAEMVGEKFMPPSEWLPAAKSVVSVFFPIAEEIRKNNRHRGREIAFEWTFVLAEGQKVIDRTMELLAQALEREGYPSVVPNNDDRFWAGMLEGRHTSHWSERHIAYVAGLGTFGLSRGIITRRGMAGRFGSLVTAAPFLPDERDYEDLYQYCTRCGVCVRNCPSGAISLEHGKNNLTCCTFLDGLWEQYGYKRGCGQCQVGVPCESRLPGLRTLSAK